MNDRQLEYMLLIAQEQSLSKAAKKLRVSQPSLSQMVKLVESDMGCVLFDRTETPLKLTYAGEKYIEAAKRIMTINDSLKKEIDEITSRDFGVIRLGIPVQRGLQVVPYILPRFRKRYPHVEIQLEENGSGTLENMVRNGEVDMACMTAYPKYEELEYILVKKETLVFLTAKTAPIAGRIPPGTPISVNEVKNESFISLKKGHSVRETQNQLFAANDITPHVLLETANIEIAKQAAVASEAMLLCPANYLATTPGTLTQMAVYPAVGVENRRHFYICHRRDLYLTKFMKGFIEMMTNAEAMDYWSSSDNLTLTDCF